MNTSVMKNLLFLKVSNKLLKIVRHLVSRSFRALFQNLIFNEINWNLTVSATFCYKDAVNKTYLHTIPNDTEINN